MDHIVTDFWSMTVLARELLASYEANKTGKTTCHCRSSPPVIQIMSAGRNEMLEGPQGENIGNIGGIILAVNFLL